MLSNSVEKDLRRIRLQGEIRDLKDELDELKKKRFSTFRFLVGIGGLFIFIIFFVGFSIYSSDLIKQSDLPPSIVESSTGFDVGQILLVCVPLLLLFYAVFDFTRLTMQIRITKDILEDKQKEYDSIH